MRHSEGPEHTSMSVGHSTIAALLQRQALARPDAPAVLSPGRAPLDFERLCMQVRHVAGVLRSHGASPKTRVAVALPNGPEMATAFLAVAACAVCIPLNPAAPASELGAQLRDMRARILVVDKTASVALLAAARDFGAQVLQIESDASLPAGRFVLGTQPTDHLTPSDLAQPDDVALLLRTSGTTARPKTVALTQAQLAASVHSLVEHLALTPADRCINVRPLFHVNGLVSSVLASLASGGSVVCMSSLDETFFDALAQYEPTWYSAVPTMHQWIIAHGALYRQRAPRHRFRFVRSGAAPLAQATLRSLEDLLGAPVIESYGMTERTPITVNPLPPALRKPGSVGLPAGVEIALLDEHGNRVSTGAVGEIVIRGPGVVAAYEHAEDNAAALVEGWFRTGDAGRFDEDGYLYITGRLKEIVNRGGQKISPREIDEALLEHRAVAQAASFGVAHETLGEDLVAAVVLRAGASADESMLRRYLLERLAPFKVPSSIVVVAALPVGATGKVQRAELQRTLAGRIAKHHTAPRNATERSIEAIFREVLGCGPVGVHDSFFSLGGDSLRGTRVIARLNQRFGAAFTMVMLFERPSIAELAVEIEAAQSSLDDWCEAIVTEIAQLSDEEVARLLVEEQAAAG